MAIWFCLGNFKGVKGNLKLITQINEFKSLFNADIKRYYIPKFIDLYDNEKFISFGTIFNDASPDDLSVFLKIDIEGGEYRCIKDIIPYLDKINGIIIEFHSLDICDEKFKETMQIFTEKFYIVHIHGNNYDELIYKTNIPRTLEITFIHKKLICGIPEISKKTYPVKNLDYPCNPNRTDYQLYFD